MSQMNFFCCCNSISFGSSFVCFKFFIECVVWCSGHKLTPFFSKASAELCNTIFTERPTNKLTNKQTKRTPRNWINIRQKQEAEKKDQHFEPKLFFRSFLAEMSTSAFIKKFRPTNFEFFCSWHWSSFSNFWSSPILFRENKKLLPSTEFWSEHSRALHLNCGNIFSRRNFEEKEGEVTKMSHFEALQSRSINSTLEKKKYFSWHRSQVALNNNNNNNTTWHLLQLLRFDFFWEKRMNGNFFFLSRKEVV